MNDKITVRNAQQAFEDAIRLEVFSLVPEAFNFVGRYMYMYTDPVKGDAFKHYGTREYVFALEAWRK